MDFICVFSYIIFHSFYKIFTYFLCLTLLAWLQHNFFLQYIIFIFTNSLSPARENALVLFSVFFIFLNSFPPTRCTWNRNTSLLLSQSLIFLSPTQTQRNKNTYISPLHFLTLFSPNVLFANPNYNCFTRAVFNQAREWAGALLSCV